LIRCSTSRRGATYSPLRLPIPPTTVSRTAFWGNGPMDEAHSFKNNSSQYREFMIIGIASQY
jgi:hypothetical protein